MPASVCETGIFDCIVSTDFYSTLHHFELRQKHNEIVPAWEAYLGYTVFTFSAQEVCLCYRRPDNTLGSITQDDSTGRENS